MSSRYELNTKIETKIVIVLAITFLCCIVSVCLYISEGYIVEKKVSDYSLYSQDSNLLFSIDDIEVDGLNENGYIEIVGWACEEGSGIVTYNCHVALEDALRGTVYILPTMMVCREDLKTYYENAGYEDSGFYSKAGTRKMQLDDRQLEVIIIYENNDSKIYYHTDIFVES